MQDLRNGATRTRALLGCGIAAGLVFFFGSVLDGLTRDGFDLKRHPISLLMLGEHGWIQSAIFIATGVLAIVSGIGVRRALAGTRAGTWGPILLAAFGVGAIVAGLFAPDPGLGFPAGAPDEAPATMSWHSSLHGLGFAIDMSSLVAACIVFARRFAGRHRGWMTYCIATAVALPVLVAASSASPRTPGVALLGVALAISAWLVAIFAKVLRLVPSEPALPHGVPAAR